MEIDFQLIEQGSNYSEYKVSKEFEGDIYTVIITAYRTFKSEKFWIAASSGKKKKHRKVLEEKELKSRGGIKALLWIKEVVLAFPAFYENPHNKKQYIVIHWSDSRRRNIYKRLEREGFKFAIDEGFKVLMKRLC